MRLYIKQKVFSFKDKFNVFDEQGDIKYQAEGELFSLGKKLHVRDNSGTEVIFIKQRIVSFLPKYEITVNGGDTVEIIKKFTLFKHEYVIPAWGITMNGDFFAHTYKVYKYGKEIAGIVKEIMSWGDSYTIYINDPADEFIALAAILVVDCCMENSSNDN